MVAGITGLVESGKVQESMAGTASADEEGVQAEQPWSLVESPVAEDETKDVDDDDVGADDDEGADDQDAGSTEETEEADEFEDFDDDDFDDEFDDDFEEELDEDYDANEDNFGDDFDSNGVDFPGDDSFGKPTGDTPGSTKKADQKSTD